MMNVNVDAKGLHEIIKELPYKFILLLLSVISALLIFLPDIVLDKLFFLDLRNRIGTFLGIIFLISTCITVFAFLAPAIKKARLKSTMSGKKAKKRIEELTNTDKQIIAYMYNNQESNITLPSTNSTIIKLKNLVMISSASSIGFQYGSDQVFPYFLQPWVITTIDKYPELLKGVPKKLPKEFDRFLYL